MGEWSEYFEDFPEEDPANEVNGVYDPEGAAALRRMKAAREQVRADSQALQKKLDDLARSVRQAAELRKKQV